MKQAVNVLVVEHDPGAQLLLTQILNSDPRLHVMGTASNGAQTLELVHRIRPDVVLMDVHLPDMDAYQTSRRIMETRPTPIVVCSANVKPTDVSDTLRAIEAGALALVPKPLPNGQPNHEEIARQMIETVWLMSEVKLVRRWPRSGRTRSTPPPPIASSPEIPERRTELIAIGASTGGPPAIQTILSGLPRQFPVPILIVQHIAAGFVVGLAEWLERTTGFACSVAGEDEPLLPGHAYLAPDGVHLALLKRGHAGLSRSAPENGVRPSVGYLFRSIAEICAPQAIAVLLSGMGRDGAGELKLLKQSGALTIVQDAATAVVNGMPGEAVKLGAATRVLAPDRIGSLLAALTQQNCYRSNPIS